MQYSTVQYSTVQYSKEKTRMRSTDGFQASVLPFLELDIATLFAKLIAYRQLGGRGRAGALASRYNCRDAHRLAQWSQN